MSLVPMIGAISGTSGGGGGTQNPAPTSVTWDNYNYTFIVDGKAPSFDNNSDYEFSSDSGATWSTCLDGITRQIVPYGSYSVGVLRVRTKAGELLASDPIANDVAYAITGTNTGKAKIINRGDSISTNIDSAGYSWQLEAVLGSAKFTLPIVHSAIAGTRYTEWAHNQYGVAQIPIEIAVEKSAFDAGSSRNIVILQLGTNDCVYDSSDNYLFSYIQDAVRTVCKRFVNRGWKLILHIPPEPNHNPATADNVITLPIYNTFRNWILSVWNTELCASALIDVYTDAHIGKYTTATASLWGDPIHPNGSGMTYIKDLDQPVVEAIEAQVSLIPPAPSVSFDYTAKTMTLTLDTGYAMADYLYTLDGMDTMNELTGLTVSVAPGTLANKAGFYRRSIGKNSVSPVTYNGSSF